MPPLHSPFRTPHLLTPLAVWIGSLTWMPRLLPQITAIDRFIHRISGGRWTLLRVAGLPHLMLTVPGRKSGTPRRTPLLCVPHDGAALIAGSNFGGPRLPVWVLNLRAASSATVQMGAVQQEVTWRELTGEERQRAWEVMVRTWPNYAKYAERTSRTIPVFLLTPVDGAAAGSL